MKVLFVRNTVLGESGAAAIHYLPMTLSLLGHEVTMVVKAGGDASALVESGVRVVEVEEDASWFFSLHRIARGISPNIIHVFIHAGCGLYPLLMKSSANPKFVLDIRSPLLRAGFLRKLVQLKNKIEVMGYDAICTHGVESGQTVVGKRCRLHWVPPGVDFSLFPDVLLDKARNKEITSKVKLVYAGSLDAKRDIGRMLDGVIVAAKKVNLSLDIFGDGNARDMLESQVEKSGLSEKIRFLGSMFREELFQRLPGYDAGLAYIPTSLYDTAPPLKTLEYLAAGLPVVATNTAGNRMFVVDGENGVLTGENPAAYADGIIRIAKATWTQEARVRARELARQYDWERIVQDKLLPVYQGALDV